MKATPIIMSGAMVRALLEGRKTQTRRPIKPQPSFIESSGRWKWPIPKRAQRPGCSTVCYTASREWHAYMPDDCCQYGKAGDLLWVRETVERAKEYGGFGYPADGTWFPDRAWTFKRNTVPSIHMPRWASRLTLELTDVRVQRLGDITDEDATAEGLSSVTKDGGRTYKYGIPDRDGFPGTDDYGWPWDEWSTSPRGAYFRLWDKLHGILSCGENLWVWVLSFTVHQVNIDAFIKAKEATAA